MLTSPASRLLVLPLPLLFLFAARPASPAQQGRGDYDRAYVMEHEEGDLEGALELYRAIAASNRADEGLRSRARSRARSLEEEIAAGDLAALMPGNAIVYLELGEPAERLGAFLEELGLLAAWEKRLERGAESIAVSPLLLQGALGIRGAAVALTSLPIHGGPPGGVLVLHPGDIDLVRGVLETAIPAGGQAVDPIGGHPTWSMEGEVLVTLTSRLLVASPSREEIAGVLRRAAGDRGDSLAQSDGMQRALRMRGEDLLFFCVDAKPLRPMAKMMLESAAAHDPGAAVAAAMLDVESLDSLAGRLGVGSEGLALDLSLRLEEGHRSLAFNLLRGAPVDRTSLELVPEGAAALLAIPINRRGPAIGQLEGSEHGAPVVTMMDFGREIFANVVGITLYALPPSSTNGGGAGIPDVAAVIGANDPARSRAIWNLVLGLANVSSGDPGASMQPERVEVAGRQAEVYTLPNGIPVYLAALGGDLVVTPSRSALERSIAARKSGRSVLADPLLADALARVDGAATGAMVVHAGRAAKLARPFLDAEQRGLLDRFEDELARTVLSEVCRHSPNEMSFSLALRGLPDIGQWVSARIAEEKERGHAYAAAYGSDSRQALDATGQLMAEGKADPELLRRRFDLLALEEGDLKGACALGETILEKAAGDARFLNNLAWALLTDERYGQRFDELALRLSVASNEASDHASWQFLDTLALARFRRGELEEAVRLQELALGLSGSNAEVEAALERYRAALAGATVSASR